MLQIAGLYSEPQLIYTSRFLVYAEKYLTLEFVRCMSLSPQAHRFRSERD